MEDIVVYGAGGFAREVIHLLEIINNRNTKWNILGYIDDNIENQGKQINGYKVLGDRSWLEGLKQDINVVMGIGDPKTKKNITNHLLTYNHIHFPNIIHPDVYLSKYNRIGQGNIICEGNILTCNINIGNFVTINLNCTIGHDVQIDDYVTILPNASISGNVHLQEGVDFGTNATIIQGKTVGTYSIIGASSCITKDIPGHCTAVGIPAKPIKFHEDY